ncbi:MAG: MMPL family transporter [Deltaproteobacteria bacterium]|nr:MMPL family transporter [Deltaproteobacteria bacterium]
MKAFFHRFVRFLLKFYGWVLLATLIAAGFSFPRMIHLFKTISTDPVDLLPKDSPSVQALLRMDRELDFKDMEEKYKKRYGAEEASSEYYVSPNGKIFAIYVESKKANLNLAEERTFQDVVRKIAEGVDLKAYSPDMKLYFGGSTRVMEYRALIHDLKLSGTISGILIFLPLLLRFRRPVFVLLIFLPLMLGIPIGLALSSLWVPKLNVTTSFLFAILGGLGVETGIHLFSRYYEMRSAGEKLEDTLADIYLSLGPAVLTAVASLAVTFLFMTFSDFRGFSEFGLISGIGLWVLFIVYFTFFPALLILSEKIRLLKFGGAIQEYQGNVRFSPGFVRTVLVIFSLITVFSLLATPFLGFEYDSKKIRADTSENRIAKQRQRVTAGERVSTPAAVLIQSQAQADAIKAAVEKIRDSNPATTLQGTNSVYSLVPDQQLEKTAVIREIQALLEDDTIKLVPDDKRQDLDRFKKSLAETAPFTAEAVPREIEDRFLGDRTIPGSLMLILPKPRLELDDGRNALAFSKEIGRLETSAGTFQASSDAIIFAEVLRTMFRDSKKVLVISVLSVFLFVFLDFRNLRKSLLVMFSILAGVFWVFGVMYLTGLKLNLYNMVMIPAVMGMSIDNSIHVFHRYEELGKGSLSKVLSTTGISAMLASFTNAAGFFGLVFCTHGGLKSMGLLATIGLGTCLITTLLYLPMILQFLEGRRRD